MITLRTVLVLPGILLLATTNPAWTESGIEDHMRLCVAIPTDDRRLNCFDSVADRFLSDETATRAPTAEASQQETRASHWRLRKDRSPIDDSESVFLSTLSTEANRDRFGREYLPRLTLRCVENTTALVINFDGQFMSDTGGHGRVDFRFDDQAATEVSMQESTDNQALGLWRGSLAIPMLRQIVNHDQLLVRYVPVNESAGLAIFDISGAAPGIAEIAEACNWNL